MKHKSSGWIELCSFEGKRSKQRKSLGQTSPTKNCAAGKRQGSNGYDWETTSLVGKRRSAP